MSCIFVLSTCLQPVLLGVAWLLLLLVSITPIPKAIYFVRIAAGMSLSFLDVTGSVRLGVWGYCTSGLTLSLLGISGNSGGWCSPRRLGYTIDPAVADALQVNITHATAHTLSAGLVLHLVGCILLFLALCILLYSVYRDHSSEGLASTSGALTSWAYIVITALAFFNNWLAFAFDIVFTSEARSNIKKEAGGKLHVTRGSATWLTLTAAILTTTALVMAILRHQRRKLRSSSVDEKRKLDSSNHAYRSR